MIGPPTLLDVDVIEGVRARWTGPVPSDGTDVAVQVRAHGDALPARVSTDGDRVTLDLASPLRGVAAGQAAVLYDGTRVMGSSTIERTTCVSTAVATGAGTTFAVSDTGSTDDDYFEDFDDLVAMNSDHAPEISNNFFTRSDGSAPCFSHLMAFSLSTVRAEGSDCGW